MTVVVNVVIAWLTRKRQEPQAEHVERRHQRTQTVGDGFDEAQADAGALGFAAEFAAEAVEALEDPCVLGGRDSGALIAHRQFPPACFLIDGNGSLNGTAGR